MDIGAMPQNGSEVLWYVFNILLIVLVAWAKIDLGRINKNIENNRIANEKMARDQAAHIAKCDERHKHLDQEIIDLKRRVEP